MKWLDQHRKSKKPDTTGPQELIRAAHAATARSEIRSDYIDIVNGRLQERIEKNHFGEGLAKAWTMRKEKHA